MGGVILEELFWKTSSSAPSASGLSQAVSRASPRCQLSPVESLGSMGNAPGAVPGGMLLFPAALEGRSAERGGSCCDQEEQEVSPGAQQCHLKGNYSLQSH